LIRFSFSIFTAQIYLPMTFKTLYLFLIAIILFSGRIAAQSSYYPVPNEFKRAVNNQTRTTNGLPGANYWQNSTNYKIEAEVFPEDASLRGKLEAEYFNNSPDTLKRLVFNMYQDILKKGNSRDWDLGTEDLHEGTVIHQIKIDNKLINIDDQSLVIRTGTKLIVRELAILPGSKVKVFVDWEVKLPTHRTVRMGKYSDSILFVAYWYPQIAVYDDIDGWDMISYGGSVEFYNDFNNYEVELILPARLNVWATGLLQNPEDVYPQHIVNRFNKAMMSDTVINIIRIEDFKAFATKNLKKTKRWKYVAKEVPDFSFGAGIGMLWDGVSFESEISRGERVFIDAVYPPGSHHWDKVAEFGRTSIRYMTESMPSIPFPYPKMTNFCNGRSGGGMETPMMANNSAPNDEPNSFGLTYHEIAHNYFPFSMGTNEKKYAWMDEGWASLWPHALVDSLYPEYKYFERTISTFEAFSGREMDVPPMIPNNLMAGNYATLRHASYVKPALAFYFLEEALGRNVFLTAMHEFMFRWAGKHPLPLDFFHTVEQVADIDLSWYFKPWLYDFCYPDLSIRKITNDRKVVIENIGGLPLPVYMEIVLSNGSSMNMEVSLIEWSKNKDFVIVDIPGDIAIRSVKIGNPRIPDIDKKNNEILILD
jgi:hypothetical protein